MTGHRRNGIGRTAIILVAWAALGTACSRDGALPPDPVMPTGSDFNLGQPRTYFVRKWGEPLPGLDDTWRTDGLTTTVRFRDGAAAVLTYRLAYVDWTDDQIRAALAANGTGWRTVDAVPGESPLRSLGDTLLHDFGAPTDRRFISAQGAEARVSTGVMVVKSADQLADEQDSRDLQRRRQSGAPPF